MSNVNGTPRHAADSSRDYVDAHISPTLNAGLVALCKTKPADPISWLANWLIRNKPPPVQPQLAPDAKQKLLTKQLTERFALVPDTYAAMDADGDGTVGIRDLETIFGREKAREAMRSLDLDGDGRISREEWLAVYGALQSGLSYRDTVHPFEGISESSRRIMYNLIGFLDCRDAVERTALAVLPHSFLDRFPSFSEEPSALRQAPASGSAAVSDYDSLVAHNAPVKDDLIALVRAVLTDVGLDPDAPALHDGKPVADGKSLTCLTIGPLKSRERCDEKAANEYDGQHARIIDCVRCSIIVDTEEQLLAVTTKLRDAAAPSVADLVQQRAAGGGGAFGGGGAPPPFAIVRLKNRYKEPLFNGYRDALYSVALAAPDGGIVVCEVQLHLGAILTHKKASHRFYEFFRSYFRGASDAIEQRMTVLSKLTSLDARSPDALMHSGLSSSSLEELDALDTLFGVQMLGDYPSQTLVRQRRLELAIASNDALRIASEQELLSASLWRTGKLAEAEPYCRDCLATRLDVLGPSHQTTLDISNLLAHILKDGGQYAAALPLYRKVLAARTDALGAHHLGTAAAVNNLAVLLSKLGEMEEAEQLFRDALGPRAAKLGGEHRDTLLTTYLLAETLERQPTRRSEALALYETVYEARCRSLGLEHGETRQVLEKLEKLREQSQS